MDYSYALLALGFGYLIGSIPFGLVLCKMAGLGDIRKIGSGNIGATNVLRTGNKPLAAATLILDIGKGAIAVLLTILFFSKSCEFIHCITDPCPCVRYPFPVILMAMLAGFGALLGHCYPIWLKFKGGKGVATTLGTLIAISPIVGLITCILWLITALIFRISSLSALVAVGLSPFIATAFSSSIYLSNYLPYFCAAIAFLVFIKHRENIKRIIKGEEPRINLNKKNLAKKK